MRLTTNKYRKRGDAGATTSILAIVQTNSMCHRGPGGRKTS